MPEPSENRIPDAVALVLDAYRDRSDAAAQARANADQTAALIPAAEQKLLEAEKKLREIRDQFATFGRTQTDAENNAQLLLQMARATCENLGLPMPDLPARPYPAPQVVPLPNVGSNFCHVGTLRVHLGQVFLDREQCGWRWLGTIVPSLNGGPVPQMHRTNDDAVTGPFDFLHDTYGPLIPISPCQEDPPRHEACTGDYCDCGHHGAEAGAYTEETNRVSEILGQPVAGHAPQQTVPDEAGEVPDGSFQSGGGHA